MSTFYEHRERGTKISNKTESLGLPGEKGGRWDPRLLTFSSYASVSFYFWHFKDSYERATKPHPFISFVAGRGQSSSPSCSLLLAFIEDLLCAHHTGW